MLSQSFERVEVEFDPWLLEAGTDKAGARTIDFSVRDGYDYVLLTLSPDEAAQVCAALTAAIEAHAGWEPAPQE